MGAGARRSAQVVQRPSRSARSGWVTSSGPPTVKPQSVVLL